MNTTSPVPSDWQISSHFWASLGKRQGKGGKKIEKRLLRCIRLGENRNPSQLVPVSTARLHKRCLGPGCLTLDDCFQLWRFLQPNSCTCAIAANPKHLPPARFLLAGKATDGFLGESTKTKKVHV